MEERVIATDGIELAVSQSGDPADPTIICVHGYPDNRTVWDPVASRLSEKFHVVTYDVRGAGESGQPARRSGYLIEQLNADLKAVADKVSPDEPVHLLAHDWGSIQTWEAVTGNIPASRIASYTSISGPSLDHAGVWLRGMDWRKPSTIPPRLKQLLESYYIFFFQAPRLPELAWRSGAVDKMLAEATKIGRPAGVVPAETSRTDNDRINGIELYRANIMPRLLRPNPRRTSVPVQVIAPKQDIWVSHPLQTQAPAPYVSDLRVVTVDGGHWIVLDQPGLIADHVTSFISGLTTWRS